jgi:hypothetical protein
MDYITRQILAQAVQAQESNRFDTHDVIRAVMRLAPQEYVYELYHYVDTEDPFKPVHGAIGSELAQMQGLLIQQHDKVETMNVRGQLSPVETWERI